MVAPFEACTREEQRKAFRFFGIWRFEAEGDAGTLVPAKDKQGVVTFFLLEAGEVMYNWVCRKIDAHMYNWICQKTEAHMYNWVCRTTDAPVLLEL